LYQQVMGMALYGWVSQSTKTVLTGASVPSENFLILAKTDAKSEDDTQFLNGAHPRAKDGSLAQSAATEPSNETPAASPDADSAAAPSDPPTNGEEAARLDQAEKGNREEEITAAATANLTGWWGQQIPFKTLVSSGALAKNSSGTYGGSGGFTMGWDNCSNTPYLFNAAQKTVVSYDGA
jgi:chitinase